MTNMKMVSHFKFSFYSFHVCHVSDTCTTNNSRTLQKSFKSGCKCVFVALWSFIFKKCPITPHGFSKQPHFQEMDIISRSGNNYFTTGSIVAILLFLSMFLTTGKSNFLLQSFLFPFSTTMCHKSLDTCIINSIQYRKMIEHYPFFFFLFFTLTLLLAETHTG